MSGNRMINVVRGNEYSDTRKRTISPRFMLGPVSLQFLTIALIALCSLFYLTQNSRVASKGYELQQLQDIKDELVEQSSSLRLEAARLQSIQSLKDSAATKDMVEANNISYLKSESANVASK